LYQIKSIIADLHLAFAKSSRIFLSISIQQVKYHNK